MFLQSLTTRMEFQSSLKGRTISVTKAPINTMDVLSKLEKEFQTMKKGSGVGISLKGVK